jgi:zinc D-Ala-D-Ala dipeptidase
MFNVTDYRQAIRERVFFFVILFLFTSGFAFPVFAEKEVKAAEGLSRKVDDLVDIKEINPHIIVDMKYAAEDNFVKTKLYDSNTCFLRRSTASKLDTVQRKLEGMNLGLKVWDCYRPLAVQKILWAILPNERYVANPEKGSRHNRASAVDLTLVDLQGNELQMPTGFDDFSPRAHRQYQDIPEGVFRNRTLLEGMMKKAGFIPLPEEWWHYDDEKWMEFDILNVPFEKLFKHHN